ncbi:MAG: WbqC family protein [Cyclobacteriaceae bacterium]|nr:WbqC family protein [Cyclobacteriaceae bacterium]
MNNRCVIELHYLPCIAWFAHILQYDEVIIEKYEHYEKQSYRNRCHIRAAHGLHRLIVPVNAHGKVPVHQVKIDYAQKWLNNHWRTVTSAYRLSPFFEYYEDELHRNLSKRYTYLYDLNMNLLQVCLSGLKANVRLRETSAFQSDYGPSVTDLRNQIHPKKKPNGSLIAQIRYRQVFGTDFMENMSVIDLLSCTGPDALRLLTQTATASRTN